MMRDGCTRREFLAGAALGAGALAFPKPQGGRPRRGKPNIVLILSDDAGYADFSMNGCKEFSTPNIDSIARRGVRFTQGYMTASVCSPSRAGLLTGRYQQRFGHEMNIGSHLPSERPEFIGLRPDQVTIADVLKKAGYYTGAVGKWHLGSLPKYHPCNRGFDEFYGFLGGGSSYFLERRRNATFRNFKKVEIEPYLTDAFGDEACAFIRRNKDRPFFLYLAFNAVHTPMMAKKEDMAGYEGIRNKKRRILAGMTKALDRQVGNVLETLRELGLEENTLLFFLNDNGGAVFYNASRNSPLNGKKGTFLEGGIRVPFLIQWPAALPGGMTYEYPVSALDVLPTAAAAAGAPLPKGRKHKLDGVDLLPYLRGEKKDRPHRTLYWRRGFQAAIRQGDMKLIRLPDRLPLLFDLSKDVSEQHDLLLEKPDLAQALMKKLFQWESTLTWPAWHTEYFWVRNNVHLYDLKYPL